jgi:hypothetical protein
MAIEDEDIRDQETTMLEQIKTAMMNRPKEGFD